VTPDESQLPEVGFWAEDKHARVRAYVDLAAKAVGKDFIGPGKGGFCYIDPFCGAGRARVKGTDRVIDGSPLVAAAAARAAGAPFTCMYIADIRQSYVDQCAARLRERGEHVRTYVGPASSTSAAVARDLPVYGLHFAFLDPFNLEALPFEAIQRFAAFKRMDILVHFSSMDLQRNFDDFVTSPMSPLDTFAPGWRDRVKLNMPRDEQRRLVREHWQSLLANAGFPTADGIHHMQGSKNQTLYWLLFAAKARLARKLWDAILQASTSQRGFNF
jgi:three-Cys-motif partner protein